MTPLIIEAAINGATPKARNPHVPRSVDEIVDDALACLAAGAAIVHNHNDDAAARGTGRLPTEPYAAAWERILARRPDALLYPTMAGGGPHTTIQTRYAHVEELAARGLLRLGIIDPGSVNLGGLDPDGVPAATEVVYQNTYADVRYMMDTCRALGLAPSISIFEPGFLRLALAYHAAGRLPRGAMIKLYFGGGRPGFGLPPTRISLDAYLAMLEGTGLPWSVAVLGGDVVADGLARLAIERGGHVRVGLEDYFTAPGRGAAQGTPDAPRRPRNEELVGEVVELARAAGRPVATPAQAAEILGVPSRAA
jgi:3-keto-5-aminohexanoate cleavage enzyme